MGPKARVGKLLQWHCVPLSVTLLHMSRVLITGGFTSAFWLLTGACTVEQVPAQSKSQQAEALFYVPKALTELSAETWLDLPFPNDLRRETDGSIRLEGFYNPYGVLLINDYISATKGLLKGFSTSTAAFLRFTGELDPLSLPETPQKALARDATVQLIDIDPASPERGQRKLIEWYWRANQGVYWLANTLSVAPAFGYPLRAKNKYAVVVTTGAHDTHGRPVSANADLQEVLGIASASSRTESAAKAFASAISEIEAAGVLKSTIAHMTVYTTNDPTEDLFALTDDVHANVAPPQIDSSSWKAQSEDHKSDYDVYEAVYGPSPNYQAGTAPYFNAADGGGFVFSQGKPQVQNLFQLRFALVIPNATKCPSPTEGYPIVLYAHGTGGDYRSVLGGSGPAKVLAQQCIASMGIDQIFHGTRPGAPPPGKESEVNVYFFNVNNVIALRSNPQQAAIDVVQQARLFSVSKAVIPPNVSRTGQEVHFDATRMVFIGHSQGGLNGPLFLAADKQTRGGVLSGAGGLIGNALLEKTEPEPSVAGLVKTFLQLHTAEEKAELSLFHPVIALAQTIADASDPYNYAPYFFQRPRSGFSPKSVLQYVGVSADGTGDHFTPPRSMELLGVAAGLPRLAPGIRPIPELAFGGLGDLVVPTEGTSGNLAAGLASGAIVQVVPTPGHDGHFAAYTDVDAYAMIGQFTRNLMDDPKGRMPVLGSTAK